MKRVLVFLIVSTDVVGAVYVSVLTYLMTIWMLDDGIAEKMADFDWYFVGIQRLGLGCVFALVVALLYYVLYYFVSRTYLSKFKKPLLYSLFLSFIFIFTTSLVGSINFVIDKPYM